MGTLSQSPSHRTRTSKPHQEPRARRSHKRESSAHQAPEKRVHVQLIDLDDLRDSIKIGIRETSRLRHIASFLKRRYDDRQDEEPISEDARVIFYWMDKCLLGDEIPSGISRIHYRALECDEEDDGDTDILDLKWSTNVHLDADQFKKARCALRDQKTVGRLRSAFACILETEDANRIVISALGGLRPGLLQGNNWDVNKVKNWLCDRIWIDIAPPKNYIILKGLNEEYIFHPPLDGNNTTTDFQTLRNWLLSRIITNVHYRASSRLNVEEDDIVLTCRGRILDKRRRVHAGHIVYFELTRAVEDKFIAEEAWLVPETETCVVCSDNKRVSEMPRRITKACEHNPNTCKSCVGQWITSSMDTLAWDRLKCPECPELLRYKDVQTFAAPEVFSKYDTLAMKAAVASIRDFKWCLNPRCNSGQIVRPGCEKLKCHNCKALSCAQHDLPWHKGETCEEFDKRTRKQRRGERASEKKVKDITKPCPRCLKDVYKFSGCDHITCVCGHEWCYVCLETYYHDRNSFLQCKHKEDCKYFENPPNYEGGRAFMPFLNHMQRRQNNQGLNFERFGPPPRQRPPPPAFDEWQHGPILPDTNPFQPIPVPPPADEEGPQPQVERDADPGPLFMEDFPWHGNNIQLHINHVRRNVFYNDFLGAAAMFTMEQLMQRAR